VMMSVCGISIDSMMEKHTLGVIRPAMDIPDKPFNADARLSRTLIIY